MNFYERAVAAIRYEEGIRHLAEAVSAMITPLKQEQGPSTVRTMVARACVGAPYGGACMHALGSCRSDEDPDGVGAWASTSTRA
jgi:hypothetical protein